MQHYADFDLGREARSARRSGSRVRSCRPRSTRAARRRAFLWSNLIKVDQFGGRPGPAARGGPGAHRAPAEGAARSCSREAVVFFTGPRYDVLLEDDLPRPRSTTAPASRSSRASSTPSSCPRRLVPLLRPGLPVPPRERERRRAPARRVGAERGRLALRSQTEFRPAPPTGHRLAAQGQTSPGHECAWRDAVHWRRTSWDASSSWSLLVAIGVGIAFAKHTQSVDEAWQTRGGGCSAGSPTRARGPVRRSGELKGLRRRP